MTPRVVIVGAGVGGLAAAISLGARGIQPQVLERAATAGGKLREVKVGNVAMDAGPTVFTLREIFDELLAQAGLSFDEHLPLTRANILARHAWADGSTLDLYADPQHSADAIGQFAGAAEAQRFLRFMHEARRVYSMLERPYLHASRPTPVSLAMNIAAHDARNLLHLHPFSRLWAALNGFFRDPRLQQLFGRYATYCGSSPYLAPATLMLIAHVEREGVWLIEGGMHRLARVMVAAARSVGATVRYDSEVAEILVERGRVTGVMLKSGERIDADAVIVNADAAAIGKGLFGSKIAHAGPAIADSARSLSAVTWNLHATTRGFPLSRHTVFFSSDYAREFDEIFVRHQLPTEPTVYVCAQDRDAHDGEQPGGPERLLCLINAPATGDFRPLDASELQACEQRTFALLSRCGLQMDRHETHPVTTTPQDFHRLFPATGGALYGQATHGWKASFQRPHSRTAIPGLYLAGGSTHPGAGLPMAALSGRLAAASLLQDWVSNTPSHSMVTAGGISTP